MQRAVIAVLLVALCLGAAQAESVAATLSKSKYKLFNALVKCAGLTGPLSKPDVKVTVLAPTDAAVTTFIKAMGVSAADVLKNEQLCDALVAYHMIPAAAKAGAITAKVTAPTLIKGSTLLATKTGSKIMFADAQGFKANVVEGDIMADNSVIHGIDRVLLSRFVFTSPSAAMKYYAKSFSTLEAALKKAGLLSVVTGSGFSGTVLAPGNKAFTKAPGALALSTTTLANVLKNHVLPQARTVPGGFVSGKSYPTLLAGQSLKYDVTTKTSTINGKQRLVGTATFTSSGGSSANVIGHNVFAGKSVWHAISGVLLPATPKTTERGAAVPKRRLMRDGDRGGDDGGPMGDSAGIMAQDAQMTDTANAIQWAATTGSGADATAAADFGAASSQALLFPDTDWSQW